MSPRAVLRGGNSPFCEGSFERYLRSRVFYSRLLVPARRCSRLSRGDSYILLSLITDYQITIIMIRAFASLTRGIARSSNHSQLLQNRLILRFTSSSDPTQVSLHEEVEGKIMQVIKMGAKFNAEKFNEKGRTATFEELGFDSLDSVELVVAMEEYMGVQIPNEQAEKIQTVQAAINTFFRHLNQRVANKVMESKDGSGVQKPIQ